jgi:hypothetical protein
LQEIFHKKNCKLEAQKIHPASALAAITAIEAFQLKGADQVRNAAILAETYRQHGTGDLRKLAYILATAFYESGMRPIEERRAASTSEIWTKYQHRYWHTGYFGRGFFQLTWEKNYKLMGDIIGKDLVGKPHLMLDPYISAEVMVLGMLGGHVRQGLSLHNYFDECSYDTPDAAWHDARFVINARIVGPKDTGIIIGDLAKGLFHQLVEVMQ